MQFMLLLHEAEENFFGLTEAQQMAIVGEHMAYSDALAKAGAMVSGAPLSAAHTARLVRGTAVEDGPFADSREQLGGFYVIEAASMDEAVEWAKRCPAARTGTVEVRPVPDYGG
ncbi:MULTISPECIES: YciI family protein [Hyphobacterium]|uniref:YciI family protein n=1 Tax=Hyphobacterium vulgare TaxID=1736751 RepID=A0ABV6ZWX5_9PROT